jgi:hypothetical protein
MKANPFDIPVISATLLSYSAKVAFIQNRPSELPPSLESILPLAIIALWFCILFFQKERTYAWEKNPSG